MKRPNITPGPWSHVVNLNSTSKPHEVHSEQLCTASCGTGGEALTNARAIAAVPELLAALETALSVIEDLPYPANYPVEALRAALTKAGYEFP